MESTNQEAKMLLTVEETAKLLSLGRSKVYELISVGELPSVKIHGSRRVPTEQLGTWITAQYETERVNQGGRAW